MKEVLLVKKNKLRALFFGCAAILAVAAGFALSANYEARAGDAVGYDKNESGLTYGSASLADSPEAEPDLIEAEATNGKIGYVYKSDLNEAEGGASNPEEAVRMMEEKQQELLVPFHDALGKQVDGITKKEAEEILNKISDTSLFDDAAGTLVDDTELDKEEAEIILMEAYSEALMACGTSIPVYEVDGITVIGEFIVG